MKRVVTIGHVPVSKIDLLVRDSLVTISPRSLLDFSKPEGPVDLVVAVLEPVEATGAQLKQQFPDVRVVFYWKGELYDDTGEPLAVSK